MSPPPKKKKKKTVTFFFCNQFLVASFGTGKSIYPSQCSLHVFLRFMRTYCVCQNVVPCFNVWEGISTVVPCFNLYGRV